MRLGIDLHGGDHAPHAILEGVKQASELMQADFVLYGDEAEIRPLLGDFRAELIHCSEKIVGTDTPVMAIREKRDSSMVKGLRDLKEGNIDGFLSAGNTGALLAGGLLVTGRIRGIDRPAIATVYPMDQHMGLLVDAGANADCKPQNLVEFAVMGSFYASKVLGISNPRVGIVNIGEEPGKGNELVKNTYPLLEAAPINFIGSLEGRELPAGKAHIAVCDGFTGNVILKLSEGLAGTLNRQIKGIFMKNIFTKLGALLYRQGLRDFKKQLDYTEYGGAPLLGVNGYLVKAHGSSNAKAIKNALRYLEKYVASNIVADIKEHLQKEE